MQELLLMADEPSPNQRQGQGQGQGYQASKGQWSSSQPSQPSQDSNPTPYWN
eukprot:CAMPEP_0173303680 /NCGR_PEP_ID=MMETSP1143-20121109/19033_1 /TAXON_ID=483371 /ORGANISM="non described non described, Strain CCMP2298" /LENGTH=51 /DNA_ID=CAMNT_0014244435 /DNA_START=192 /DNA_END=347 /DNA_ORIENTATION=+